MADEFDTYRGDLPPPSPAAHKGFFGRLASGMKYVFTGRSDFFGPGQALPTLLTPEVSREAGLTGRQTDFTTFINLQRYPRSEEPISFSALRNLADSLDILRLVIETRKDQMCKLEWKIKARDGENVPQKRLDELNRFFKRPDNEHSWSLWLRSLLDDHFVIDALTIYPRRSLSGKLVSLDYVDGATIKRVIDETGRTPEPPWPAYQQIIKGQVATDYTWDELIYRPRNLRTYKFYGFSPVEQVLLTVNIALRRAMSQLDHYTEGNVPQALCGVPESWGVEQIRQFQMYFDSLLAGNLALRRRLIFIHGGMKPTFTKDPQLKDEMDEWLARVVCFAFSLPPTPFIRQMNRATAETQQETAQEEGLLPTMDFVKELMDDILELQMDAGDCEFSFEQAPDVDVFTQAQVDEIYVNIGVQTARQIAEARGLTYIEPEEKAEPAHITEQVQPGSEPAQGASASVAQGAKGAGGDSKAKNAKGAPASGKKKGGSAAAQDRGGKLQKADSPRVLKRLDPIPLERPVTKRAARKLKKTLAAFLAKQGKKIGAQLAKTYGKLQKADEKSLLDQAIDDLDLSGWAAIWEPVLEELQDAYGDAALEALLQFGIDDEGITDLAMEQAVEYAKERAAEMVGMRVVDGKLVENPNPKWAITDSTRDMLKNLVAESLEEGPSPKELAAQIAESTAFSAARADMISRTELAMAHSQGAVEGYRQARASGVPVMKEWLDSDGCEECSLNAKAGPIDLDDKFPSGDDAPPAHPNCRCAVSPVVVRQQDVDTGEEPYK